MDLDQRTLRRGAIALGIAALVVMLVVGFRPLTSVAALAPTGGYTGLIAYTESGTLRDNCVHTIDLATGNEVIDEYCAQYLYLYAFGPEGVVVDGDDGTKRLSLEGGDPLPTTVDFADEEPPRPIDLVPGEESVLVLDGVTVIELRGPGDYQFDNVLVSEDQSQVLIVDSAGRLIVARTDGTGTPMLVADNVDDVRWQTSR